MVVKFLLSPHVMISQHHRAAGVENSAPTAKFKESSPKVLHDDAVSLLKGTKPSRNGSGGPDMRVEDGQKAPCSGPRRSPLSEQVWHQPRAGAHQTSQA